MRMRSWMRLVFATALLAVFSAGCGSAPAEGYASDSPDLPSSAAPLPESTRGPEKTPTPDELPTFTLAPLPYSLPPRNPIKKASQTTPTPRAKSSPTPSPTSGEPRAYPVEYHIEMSGHRQLLPLGCEASAAVDWAAFYGVEIDERQFQADLPLSDNPDNGFVGNVHGSWGQIPPNDYGVHARPVADLLKSYGLNAEARKGLTLDEAKLLIAKEQPVIAWVIGNVTRGQASSYTDSEGNIVTVAPYEHVVIVTGYDENTGDIRYLNNGHFYDVSEEEFLASWRVLENMVIIPGENS